MKCEVFLSHKNVKYKDYLVFRYPQNTNIYTKKICDEDVIYEANYTIDDKGNRISLFTNPNNLKNIILFGASFTFGDGLNDVDVIHNILNKKNLNTNFYNFAISGTGSSATLEILMKMDLNKQFQNINYGIYSAIPSHIYRTNLSLPLSISNCFGRIFYYENNENKIITNKNKYLCRIIYQFKKSYIINELIKIYEYSFVSNDEYIKHHVNQIVAIKNILKQNYNSEFIYLLWPPNNKSEEKIYKDLIKVLKLKKIRLFEIINIIKDIPQKDRYIINDGHPSAKSNYVIANNFDRIINYWIIY